MNSATTGAALTLDDLLDREAIRQALARYARGMDRQNLELVLEAYWPDARDAHGPIEGSPQEFAEFAQASWPTLRMEHTMGQSYIELAGNFANVETYFIAHHHLTAEHVEYEYLVGGRYNDRFEKRDGAWKVLNRVVVYDWRKRWNRGEADANQHRSLPARNRGATAEDYTWELFSGRSANGCA
jgi:hypothetical protein